MKVQKFNDPDPEYNGDIYVVNFPDFEYVNPIKTDFEQITLAFFQSIYTLYSEGYKSGNLKLPKIEGVDEMESIKNIALKHAKEKATITLKKIISQPYNNNLNLLFTAKNRDQEKNLMKNLVLSEFELNSFIYNAFKEHNYTYSIYKCEFTPTGTNDQDLPRLILKNEDNQILTSGNSKYTKGQLKNVIEQRTIRISKFIDKGDLWHCFFYTLDGINGKEKSSRENKCHMHYISFRSNLPRSKVVNELKSRNYKLPSTPHIEYLPTMKI